MAKAAASFSAFESATKPIKARKTQGPTNYRGMTAVGYVRVSTDEQELSPSAQTDEINEWAAKHGVRIATIVHDSGVSGAAPLDERPGLISAIDALGLHDAKLLIVSRRDRLARDTVRAAFIERMVESADARVISADGIADTNSPDHKLLRAILDAMAEYERALIKQRTKAALKEKVRRGEHVGQAPYGFEVQGGRLVPVKDEQKAIATLVRLRNSGMSWRKLADAMNASQHSPKRKGDAGGKGPQWHPTSVRRIYEAEMARQKKPH